jgi:hypothetical protein
MAHGAEEYPAMSESTTDTRKELRLDCNARGLEIAPSLAIGDGALGFRKAMRRLWEATREQRC